MQEAGSGTAQVGFDAIGSIFGLLPRDVYWKVLLSAVSRSS